MYPDANHRRPLILQRDQSKGLFGLEQAGLKQRAYVIIHLAWLGLFLSLKV